MAARGGIGGRQSDGTDRTLWSSDSVPGTLSLEGDGQTLSIGGTHTLDHMIIDIGDPTPEYLADALFADGPGGQTSTLTLGLHASVVQTGSQAVLAGAGDGGLIVNRGRIDVASSGGTFTLRSLANAGQIAVDTGCQAVLAGIGNSGTIVDAGGVVSVQGSLLNTGTISIAGSGGAYNADPYTVPGLTNDGVFEVSGGATARLGLYGYGWTNIGTLAVSGGLLSVGGDFSTSELGRVQVSAGGTLGLDGALTNAGTLAIGAGSPLPLLALQAGGEIAGGVVADAGGGLLAQGGTLADVTWRGVLALASADARATIDGGLTLAAISGQPGSLAVTGAGSTLLIGSSEVLDHAAIALGASGAGAALAVAPGQTLTLGAQTTVRQTGEVASIGSAQATVANDGWILAGIDGGSLTLAGSFLNAGTLAVSHGETLVLQGSALSDTGSISVTDGTVDVIQATASTLAAVRLADSGVVVSGTLSASGDILAVGPGSAVPSLTLNGLLMGGTVVDPAGGVQFAGSPVLDGVAYRGTLAIDRPFATVTVRDGLRLADATGTLPGALWLTGTGDTLVWDSVQPLDQATLAIGGPSGAFAAPAILAAYGGPTVQLGGSLRVNQSGVAAEIGGTAGEFSSAATITANVDGGEFLLGGGRFTNTGTLGIGHGDSVTATSAAFANTGLIVVGVGSAFYLDLTAYLVGGGLSGQSFINAGRLQMAGGLLAELTEGGAFPKVPLLNRGDIFGAGEIASQIDNMGIIEARDGTLNLVQTVSGAGTLRIDSGATLVLGGVGAGQTAAFDGIIGTLGLQPDYFLGTIGGFAAGDTLDLFNTTARSADIVHGGIDVLLTDGNVLHFHTSTQLSGTLSECRGNHGDTLIQFAPAAAGIQLSQTPASALWPAFHTV